MTKLELFQALQELTKSLHRPPTRDEARGSIKGFDHALVKNQIKFKVLLREAGIIDDNPLRIVEENKLLRKYSALCSKREQIQGFFRHTLDLQKMFEAAGNPPSLKMVAQPDTHVKFINRTAYNAFLKFLTWYKSHVHMIMGDFADCEGITHWEPDNLEPKRLVPEMKLARALLSETKAASPTTTFWMFLIGNHEDWIRQALNKMPELFEGLDELGIDVSVESLLGLNQMGFEVFPLNHLVQIGKAHFTHGIYTSMHHAKKHLDVFKGNIYYGHLHDTQSNNQTSLDGNLESASLGCLCRLDAKFLKGKPNNWVNAFGIFEFFPDGSYTVVRPSIINGRFSYGGVVFDGN